MSYGPPPSDDDYSDFIDSDFDDGYDYGRSRHVAPVKSHNEQVRDQLFVALRDGQLDDLKRLLEANDWFHINGPVISGEWTALQLACYNLHEDIVQFLLNVRRADVNIFNEGQTALHRVCSVENSNDTVEPRVLKIVQHLISAKANINRPNASSQTPLMMIIQNGYDDVVDCMLSTRLVSLEMTDQDGNTAIFYAVEYNRPNVVQKLVNLRANLEATNRDGYTPSQLAAAKQFPEVQKLLPYYEERCLPPEYTSIDSHEALIPTVFRERQTPPYVQDIFPMLYGMRVQNLNLKIADGNIGLEEFLNISEDRLKEIGVIFPFQRKRILHGLLKFHQHKFKKSLLSIQASTASPIDIQEYFNTIAACLKYLLVMRTSLMFIQRKDFFGHTERQTSDVVDKHICDINKLAAKIKEQLIRMIAHFKKQHKYLSPPPPILINERSIQSISSKPFLLRPTTIGFVALGSAVIALNLLRK